MEHNVNSLLQSHPCSRGLSDDEIEQVANEATIVRCSEGEVFCKADTHLDSLFLIVSGRFRANVPMPDGSEKLYQYIRTGDQIGLLVLISDDVMPLNIVADEPSAILKISKESAIQLGEELPLFRRNLFRLIKAQVGEAVLSNTTERRPRLVAFFHAAPDTNDLVRLLLDRLGAIGEQLALMSDDPQLVDQVSIPSLSVKQKDGEFISSEAIRQQVGRWTDVNRIVFSETGSATSDQCAKLIGFVDQTFWVVTPESWKQARKTISKLVSKTESWKKQINLIWLLPDERLNSPHAPELQDLVHRTFKVHLTDKERSAGKLPNKGLERVVHYLRGVQLGIALGGGAARGMAHLGVLKALDAAGITFDMMAGTSSGAMTGVVYMAGNSPDWCIDHFAGDLTLPWYFRMMPAGGLWYLVSKYRRRAWDGMLRKYLDDLRLEQLAIPVQTVAVDLVGARQVVTDQGDAVKAILDSINLPILSKPINKNGMAIIDGGYLNVLPADVLFQRGATFVVAVNVSSTIEFEFIGNREDTPTEKMKSASISQTLKRLRSVQDRFMSSVGAAAADITIAPDVAQIDITEFTRAAEIAAIGQEATEQTIPDICRMLSRIDPELFCGEMKQMSSE